MNKITCQKASGTGTPLPLLLALLLCFCGLFTLSAQPQSDYPALKAKAEALFSEGSFAKAREAYDEASQLELPPADARWVAFCLADTAWRSAAASQSADNTQLDNARQQLEVLIRDLQTVEQHDRVWAEVEESLGDYFYTRRNSQDWGGGWPHYEAALNWWAGAADLELARARYLRIVWAITKLPAWQQWGNYAYWYDGRPLPLEILENTLKIAQTPADQAHAHFLLAMTLRNRGGEWESRQRVAEEFEAAIKPGKSTDWFDDALFNYGEWMENNGRIKALPDGNWTQEPDYPKALELFRRLVKEYKKGETRYFDQAQSQISNLADPAVGVSVANVFLPESEIQYYLNWRNIKRIDLALYPVDLTRDAKLEGDDARYNNWLESINLAGREKIKSWTHDTKDTGDHKPGGETIRLDGKLPVGAYVLEARSGGKSARELVLVTDATVVLKTSGRQALVYVCNALAGSPLADAGVKLWERYYQDNHWQWRESSKKTGADGVALFDLVRAAGSEQLFVGAVSKDRQAYDVANNYYNGNEPLPDGGWRIYAFTDRPAYRPGETAQWKFIGRQRSAGGAYTTPSERVIEYQIDDPRGAKVKADTVTLNAFGSAWGSLELTDKLPLGEYRVTFWNQGRSVQIGNAVLFRLEEYKLPEFKVTVQTPEENGRKRAFRLGEKVEVTVQADYYFGGAVANADVEIIVRQNPFYHVWHRPHDYPWLYEDASPQFQRGRIMYGGEGQIIKRETLKTDAAGKASLTFDTPRNAGQDFEYRIEARVTDESRREITGSGSVRVTGQRYYVYAEPAHNLYRPQDKVSVEFKALDANEQTVQTEGVVKVTREHWYEVWLDPQGREVKGDELNVWRSRSLTFPPLPKPGGTPWQFKFRGYEHEDILTRTLKTDTNGTAELSFTPGRDGYYRVAWTSVDNAKTNGPPVAPIIAETTVWVATTATTELGYRHGGVEIVVDQDTFQVGQKAPVMLSVPDNDRYVLFTVEGEDLYSYQLIHISGTVKLVELPIEEKHVPNIFLGATLVTDRQMFVDAKQVVVPPAKNFLTVDVQPDAAQHQPREAGAFTITTRDYHNEPVSAEVAFGLVDESVYYIQSDYAGDLRRFYFGEKHPQLIQTSGTFNQKGYAQLIVGDDKQLIDIRDYELSRRRKLFSDESKLLRDRLGIDSDAEGFSNGNDYPRRQLQKGLSGAVFDSLSQDKAEGYGGIGGIGGRGGGGGGGANRFSRMPANAPVAVAAPMSASFAKAPASEFREMPMSPPGIAGQDRQAEPAVQVRSDFRSTVVWQPDIITGKDGKATVKVAYPDSLTSWRATARAVTAENQFGMASTNTRTRQPLIVRLEAPRFFVVGDQVTISAVVNNNTEKELTVKPRLELGGILSDTRLEPAAALKVPANGEARADWVVQISAPGEARLKVTATGGKYADAMEKTYTIFEHGLEKFITKSGKVRGDDITVKLDLPKERKPGSTTLTVQVTSSMAVTMLDALPYLIDYPYGCTEQTMSRFLPAAITAKTLKDLGLKPGDVMGHLFGGIEPASAAGTHPKGQRDLRDLDEITRQSLERLYDFQHGDGGWGWWKPGDSDHFMTAYVVWGLALARTGGIGIRDGALNRGADYLDKTLVEEELNFDQQAWMLHALAVYEAANRRKATPFQTKAFDNLWNNREKLNAYTRALLALSAHNFGFTEQAKTLIANLENGVKRDDQPDTSVVMQGAQTSSAAVIGTAHWGEDGIYYRWSDGGVEATAFALRALLAIDPENKLIEPVSNWLIKNRRGAQWNNTRDTAIAVLTMNDYLRTSGELAPDLEYELLVNGQSIAVKKISGADAFSAPSRFEIDPKIVRDGANDVRIVRKSGAGAVYFAANAAYFSLEEPVTPAGSEIFVRRQYYKLVGRPTLLKGYVYDREPLDDGGSVKSGDRVQTVVTIEAKNNYEYLLFEDLKPAGLEAVEIRSGESLYASELKSGAVDRKFGTNTSAAPPAAAPSNAKMAPSGGARRLPGGSKVAGIISRPAPVTDQDHTGRTRAVYQELRDRKVALFIDKLPQGVWEIKYELRAEAPGQFHALPVTGQAMYVPEIRCNGAETRITVTEGKQ